MMPSRFSLRKPNALHKKGSESAIDITELFFALVFIAIGLSLLFVPASCNKNAIKKDTSMDLFIIDTQRDLLFFMHEPLSDNMTVADGFIQSPHNSSVKSDIEKALLNKIRVWRLDNRELHLGLFNQGRTIFSQGLTESIAKESRDGGQLGIVVTKSKKSIPLTMHLPSMDGSVLSIEVSAMLPEHYDPNRREGVYR